MTPRHSAWQAWHLVTFTFVSRGRRGTNSHLPSFCVAGVALMVLGGALGPGLGGRDAAAFCVAGVALGDIHFRFAWQAWHKLTSTVVLRGRRGTYGTGWRPCIHTYTFIRTCILSFHILSHTQSFTTSFVFPSFPVPVRTFEAHYWKKLACGVIRSFNCMFTRG